MKMIVTIFISFFLFFGTTSAQFEVGKSHVGPSIGIGFSGYGLSFGVDYEYGMSLKSIGVEAPGKIGVGGIIRYYNWSESYFTYEYSYTDIIIAVQGNYHFILKNSKIDPWIGLVLGFDIASSSYDGPSGVEDFSDSSGGVFFNGNAGARYWFSPNMAARIGFGFGGIVSSLIFGVDFKF